MGHQVGVEANDAHLLCSSIQHNCVTTPYIVVQDLLHFIKTSSFDEHVDAPGPGIYKQLLKEDPVVGVWVCTSVLGLGYMAYK